MNSLQNDGASITEARELSDGEKKRQWIEPTNNGNIYIHKSKCREGESDMTMCA